MSIARILIVDDEILIARELESRLRTMGYDVPAIASSGAEAIARARELKPDLVLMDIVIKGEMDGIDAATEIRRHLHVPIIYLTAYTDNETLDRAKVTEPYGYIVKPFSERELRANVEMTLYKHRMEQRLRKVEHWFTDAVEAVGDAVVAADAQGNITVFNQAAEAITAWRREDAVGRPVSEVIRLADRSDGRPIVIGELKNGPVVHLASDTLLFDKDNMPIPVDHTICCVRDAEERPTGSVSVMRDVLGQRHGALVALSSDVALAAVQAVTVHEMLQVCAESIVTNLDAAFARIWTVSPHRDNLLLLASAGMYTHLDGPHGRIPMGKFKIGMIAGRREPHLTNNLPRDPMVSDPEWARAEGIVSFAGYPIVIGQQVLGVLAMFARHPLPASVLKALESVAQTIAVGLERKRLEDELRQTQKMEAVGQLAGGIAHDFNNLLTVISGCSEFLATAPELSDDSRELVGAVLEATERATTLTRHLLTFGRKQVLHWTSVDINSLIVDVRRILERLITEDIVLHLTLDPSLAPVTGDVGQLEQVIVNLVVNSRDAMPDGGRITIETRNVSADESFLQRHPDVEAQEAVLLSVSDTGMGMAPEVAARVFEPFFTTKGTGRGTGLGLSTVYGIVQQCGGHVSVYSEPGIGTCVKVYLPRAARAADEAPAAVAAQALPRGNETILVAEDDDGVRSLMCNVLQSCGYLVLEGRNGADALATAEQFAGPIDMLVTDVVMPELAGRRLAEKLQELRPDIRAVYISGYTEDAVIRHGVLESSMAFLQKPFRAHALTQKVREVLDAKDLDT